MPFTLVADWWDFLDERTDGALAVIYAQGETAAAHTRVDKAARYATAAIRNALLSQYPEAAVEAFVAGPNEEDMLQHAGALAMFALTATGGGRTPSIVEDNDSAEKWLSKVRSGQQPILRLAQTLPATSESGGAVGLIRWRGRERHFDRGSGEYNSRNPKI